MSDANDESDGRPLTDLLAGHVPSCTIINDVPTDWGAVIIEVACKFMDDDGHNDNKGSAVNLPGGGSSYTIVSSYEGCCRAYIGLVKVRYHGKADVYPFTATVESGFCGGNLKWHLTPSAQFKPGAAAGAKPFEFIQR